MLTLLLLRHAKAEAQSLGDDFARELTAKGVADALALGAHMAGLGVLPDHAVVSASTRTRQTFDLFARGAALSVAAEITDDLYNATERQLRDVMKAIDPPIRTLLIVAHNPGIMEAAVHLARDGDVTDLGRLRNRFPPCSLAMIAFDAADWRQARSSGGGRLDLFLMPEDLRV